MESNTGLRSPGDDEMTCRTSEAATWRGPRLAQFAGEPCDFCLGGGRPGGATTRGPACGFGGGLSLCRDLFRPLGRTAAPGKRPGTSPVTGRSPHGPSL